MSVTSPSARLTRLALLTLTGATALSVAACGASHTTSNTAQPSTAAGKTSSATSPSTPSAAPSGKAWVSGMIASVSGDAIQVTQQAGNATVDFTPSTKITEVTPAQLTDVTAGSCVAVHPTRDSAEPVSPSDPSPSPDGDHAEERPDYFPGKDGEEANEH